MLKLKTMFHRLPFLRLGLPIIVFALVGLTLSLPYVEQEMKWFGGNGVSLDKSFGMDWDVPPLVDRLHRCPTFPSTILYWREDYTDRTPFYRPLSLTWFWLLASVFGASRYHSWMTMTLVLRAVFDVLLFVLLRRTTKSFAAALAAVVVFAGTYSLFGIPWIYDVFHLFPSTPQDVATTAWKDQPTLIADCLCLGSLICILRDRWAIAIAMTMISTLFKESGWITYALGIVLLTAAGRFRTVPVWVYPAVLAAIAVPMLMRHAAGMGWVGGLRMGNNEHWLKRLFGVASGNLLHDLFDIQPAAALCAMTGVGGVALASALPETRKRFGFLMGYAGLSLMLCALVNSLYFHVDFVTGGEQLFDPDMGLPYLGQSALFAFGAYYLWLDQGLRKWAAAYAVCSIIAALPYVAATQVLEHALHLCYAFQSALTAMAAVAVGRRIRGRLGAFAQARETTSVSSSVETL